MDFSFSEEELRFRERVREFIKENLTPEVKRETAWGVVRGPHAAEFAHKMAKAGLLGLSWPKEYGGQDLPAIYEYHLNDELARAGAPDTGKGVGIVGRTLMRHGNEYLKREFLTRIVEEDVQFAIGYTEPDAGSDLASLRLRADRDGDDYVLNGQKLFCSGAHIAPWIWLLARTDPVLPKHKGLSLFLVHVESPGITVRGLQTLGGDRTNEVFFDNVRIPKKYLVGEPNRGWLYCMEALAFERQILFLAGLIQGQFDRLLTYVRQAKIGKRTLAEDPLVRHKIARLAIDMEVCNMLELRLLAATNQGMVGDNEAAMHKLFLTHLEQRIADTALDIMGPFGALREGSEHAQSEGFFEERLRMGVIRTIGGGSSEVQKNILAKRCLGLPG